MHERLNMERLERICSILNAYYGYNPILVKSEDKAPGKNTTEFLMDVADLRDLIAAWRELSA